MTEIMQRLETERKTLGMSQQKFIRHLGLPDTRTTLTSYSRICTQGKSVPKSWRSVVANFLAIPVSEISLRERGRPTGSRFYSAEELRELADVIEKVGSPLTLETAVRVAKEIKKTAQK